MGNGNTIVTNRWSDPDSEKLYKDEWPSEPDLREQWLSGLQCGGCAFFAKFNSDWGLCCNDKSRHHLETVFEHFTCPAFIDDGWDAHTFRDWDIDDEARLVRKTRRES